MTIARTSKRLPVTLDMLADQERAGVALLKLVEKKRMPLEFLR